MTVLFELENLSRKIDKVTGSEYTNVKLQIPPLRCAPVGMTKLRAVACLGMSGSGWTESSNEGPPHLPRLPLYALDQLRAEELIWTSLERIPRSTAVAVHAVKPQPGGQLGAPSLARFARGN
jgi:hypothetical protein